MQESFLKERRASLLMTNKDAEDVMDGYFTICKNQILAMEQVRSQNFMSIKANLIKYQNENTDYQTFVRNIELSDIKEKIDYERACRRGLFARKSLNSQELMKLTVQDMQSILNKANDEVV